MSDAASAPGRAAPRPANRPAHGEPGYRRTQRARLLAVLFASGALALTVVIGRGGAWRTMPLGAWLGIAVGLVVLVACAVVFSSLTVEVDERALRWHFALGAFRQTLPHAEIASAEPTRTTLLDGIGLRFGPRGWLYNVAPGLAVRIVRRDGRTFRIGTDDPAGLVAALAAAPGAGVPPRASHPGAPR
jgi:hypothetical protein